MQKFVIFDHKFACANLNFTTKYKLQFDIYFHANFMDNYKEKLCSIEEWLKNLLPNVEERLLNFEVNELTVTVLDAVRILNISNVVEHERKIQALQQLKRQYCESTEHLNNLINPIVSQLPDLVLCRVEWLISLAVELGVKTLTEESFLAGFCRIICQKCENDAKLAKFRHLYKVIERNIEKMELANQKLRNELMKMRTRLKQWDIDREVVEAKSCYYLQATRDSGEQCDRLGEELERLGFRKETCSLEVLKAKEKAVNSLKRQLEHVEQQLIKFDNFPKNYTQAKNLISANRVELNRLKKQFPNQL
ncbi:hypothetical protein T10_1509 [Trichinella papuae]|uniref:Uncharacterized protein n=1 Tax=Trichinella papuae TaxID=268474 RepID=A0A0V1M679_9BILA|nr:hypothetical protein T10_1509 [Trichinella papuae]